MTVQKIIMIIEIKKLKNCLIFSSDSKQRVVFENKIDFMILTITDTINDCNNFQNKLANQ